MFKIKLIKICFLLISHTDINKFFSVALNFSGKKSPEGRLMQLGDVKLLYHDDEPLYIPITQVHFLDFFTVYSFVFSMV